MLVKLEDDLKFAILQLPVKEKEKLLVRLIRKDKTLINQLHFQLLEDEIDLEERREKTRALVANGLQLIKTKIEGQRYYNPKQLLINLRSISGHVNEHLLITKDKLGELDLRIYILKEIFKHGKMFFKYENYTNEKLLKYIIGRLKNILTTYDKLHEDLQYDFQEKVEDLLTFASTTALKTQANNAGLIYSL